MQCALARMQNLIIIIILWNTVLYNTWSYIRSRNVILYCFANATFNPILSVMIGFSKLFVDVNFVRSPASNNIQKIHRLALKKVENVLKSRLFQTIEKWKEWIECYLYSFTMIESSYNEDHHHTACGTNFKSRN